MALGGTDLNLLTALKVILEEGNVTRAGERLAMSQPAMSGALAKLRRRFDDELLTRRGREYELTPFAVELLAEVQESVQLINTALQVEEDFDPATSERLFRFTMSDYAIAVMHDHLLARIRDLAPQLRLRVDHLGPDVRRSERALVDYDVLIGPLGYGFPGRSRPLWRDRFVCLVDAGNPRLRSAGPAEAGPTSTGLTLQDLTDLPHAVASFGRGNLTPIDRAFGELGIDRRIQVEVAGWLPLPFVVEGTDMVAVVPERLARLYADPAGPLRLVEPPFGHVVLAEGYWFAPTRVSDAAHRWLFDRLDDVGEVLRKDDLPAPATGPA
jgi:DNA-binding transcriptional LysR family regulator